MDRRWSKLRIAQRKRGHVHAIRGDIFFHGHRDGAGEWDHLYGFVGPILRVILVSGRVAIQVIGSDLRLRWTKGILKRYEAFPDKLLAEKLAPVAAETKLPS